MADYGRPYGPTNPVTLYHTPKTVEEMVEARNADINDSRNWVVHTYEIVPALIFDICERLNRIENGRS
jgi:hypothetical protein